MASREYLYPTPIKQLDPRRLDGQFEPFNLVEKSIKQRLTHIICNAPKITQPAESMLAGSIGMALCYIARVIQASTIDKTSLLYYSFVFVCMYLNENEPLMIECRFNVAPRKWA